MDLIKEIQADILNSVPLSRLLLRAKVLAYRLKSEELREWVDHELNGYGAQYEHVPQYRRIITHPIGTFVDGAKQVSNFPIPLSVFPSEYQDIDRIPIVFSIQAIESLIERARKGEVLQLWWPAETCLFLSNRVLEGMTCISAGAILPEESLHQIFGAVRDRLLTFVMELEERYVQASEQGADLERITTPEQINRLVQVYIIGNNNNVLGSGILAAGGSSVPTFDQRNQIVQNQYNAGHDINFDNVRSQEELLSELERLRTQISQTCGNDVIDAEVVTDVEYQVTKAIQQGRKPQPDKKAILTHLDQAKSLLEGIASAAGIVTAMSKAIEVVQKLF